MNQWFLIILGAAGYTLMTTVWAMTNPNGISIKQGIRSFVTGKVGHVIYIVFILNILGGLYLHLPEARFDIVFQIMGLCLFIFGITIAIWAKLTMKQAWNVPATIDHTRQNKLIMSGPFSFSRNPIYVGILLLLFGQALFLRTLSILIVILLTFYMKRLIMIEERQLNDAFGREYEEYQSRVPRFL